MKSRADEPSSVNLATSLGLAMHDLRHRADQDVTLRSQRLHRGNVTKRALTLFKHWRGLATRYDKHVTVYRGALVLAAALLRIEDLSGRRWRAAALSAMFEPALLKRGAGPLVAWSQSVGPSEILLGHRCRGTRRLAASRGGCRPQRRIQGKESTHSFLVSAYQRTMGLRQDPGRAAEWPAEARIQGDGSREMRVLTYDSCGGVESLLGLAVRLGALGSELRVCAPPDCAERLAEVGVPLVPAGPPVRPPVHGAAPPSAAGLPRWRG